MSLVRGRVGRCGLAAGLVLAAGAALLIAGEPEGTPARAAAQDQAPATIPSFRGLTLAEASAAAAAAGLRVGEPLRWRPYPGRPGRVIDQYPAAGEAPPPGFEGAVSLTLLTGLRSTGRPRIEFRTTGGAAYCQAASEDEYEPEHFVCWTPRNGRMVTMDGYSVRMRFHRQAIGARPAGFRIVGFGAGWVSPTQSSNLPTISCYSNRKALRCADGGGFGFVLARNGTFRKSARFAG